MKSVEWTAIDDRLTKAFLPSVPVSENTLFAGRIEQIRRIMSTVNQPGQHAIVYGERGVGKTSLANILSSRIGASPGEPLPLTPRVTCDSTDDFTSIWTKLFEQIEVIKRKQAAGFTTGPLIEMMEPAYQAGQIPEVIKPDTVRRLLTDLGERQPTIVIFDEFDRISNQRARRAMADTIKVMSDHDVPATIILVGVADTVDDLLAEHKSIERATVQIKMPRMFDNELHEILEKGTLMAGLTIADDVKEEIAKLSQGLPHYTHLLGLHAGHVAVDRKSLQIQHRDLRPAIERAVSQSQSSLVEAYRVAVSSPQKDNLYASVLLACALADSDRFGYFAAADVREPLTRIVGRHHEIPAFARHLKAFCEASHGPILKKSGERRRFRYRFVNPLMQPFVIMQGILEGHVDTASLLT